MLTRMRFGISQLKFGGPRGRLIALCVVLLIGALSIFYLVNLEKRISNEKERQSSASRVEVEERQLRAPSTEGLTLYLNAGDVRSVAGFGGIHYLATAGGLIAVDDAGNVKKRFTTLDGLPDNDLTALAVFRERLFVGTSNAGLVGFDGQSFTGYRFTKPKAVHVTVLTASDSELLIGTLDGGLFEYDGQRFTRRFNSTTGADFTRVTALQPFESRLYIGTQDAGLYIWQEAHIEHLGVNDGLPSPHVTGIAILPSSFDEGRIGVATDFAVVALDQANRIKPISNLPNVTSLAVSGSHLWAGLFGGRILDLSAMRDGRRSSESQSAKSEVPGLPAMIPATVSVSDQRLWVLTQAGAFSRDEQGVRPAFEPFAATLVGDRSVAAGHITSVAKDNSGRLWVAYFDRGIDLIDPQNGEKLTHIEDDRIREINFLTFDRIEDRMLAATSRGLVVFGPMLKQTIVTRDQGGLINDSVAHISFVETDRTRLASTSTSLDRNEGRTMVLATAGGLTEISGGKARSITAFHGLASNHLYASATAGSRLFVGSLAGLVELEGLRVVRTYNRSNSRLGHDWVTALAEDGGALFIGTNGGGVDRLLPGGEWTSFADEIGTFEVNQNAMHFEGERLYVGTSDRGLLVYNTRDRRWVRITAGLASQNVTAITSDDQFIYLGTLNGLVRIEKRVIE
jgi:ligand-binding sensor domain-containing protein